MISREEEISLSPQSSAQGPCESGPRDISFGLLETEKETNQRTSGCEEARYRKYGITGEDVALFLLEQQGQCEGCGVCFSGEVGFVIDHNHATGKVRGLLCRECNIVLAHWMTPGKLRRLAKYLERADG